MDGEENKDQEFLEIEQDNPNKNIIGIIVLIIVLVAGGYFLYKNKLAWKTGQEKQEPKNVIIPQVVRISADKLQKEMPMGFPKDLPLNGKIKTLESYNAGYTQNPNIKQATSKFESSKSMVENYGFYLKWTKESNWEIINSLKQDSLASLYGQKNQATLNITIVSKISDKIKSEVNITYAEF